MTLLERELKAAELIHAACQTAGAGLADFMAARHGDQAYRRSVRTSALQFLQKFTPKTLADIGIIGDDEAHRSAIAVAIESFDCRLAEIRATSSMGGTA